LRLQAIHSLSIHSRRVKSATSSGMDVTPALFRPTQSPLAAYHLRQAPESIGVAPLPEHLYGRLGPAALSSAFADFRSVVFASRRPSVDPGPTTLLFFAPRRCRPTARSVCTLPLALRVDKNPLVATPGSRRCARGGTSLSPEPCRLSPSTYLGFHRQAFNLTVLRATWALGRFRLRLQAACLGLHATPADCSAAALPDRLPSSIRNPIRLGVFGSRCRRRAALGLCPSCDGPVLSRAPAPRWARLQC